jgi:pimeloyl-ACP methyl ester carboxylesterase
MSERSERTARAAESGPTQSETAGARHLVYLPGIAGHPELSPAMRALEGDGWEVVVPAVPGFDGGSGFVAPDDHLGWITTFWDALDATGALPCPVIGASVGGMMAAELASLRPECVTALGLIAPFGIGDGDEPGFDVYAVPAGARMAHLFAKGVPDAFAERFAERGPEEAPVARYLCDIAAASLVWPLGDRGLAGRIHRISCPTVVVWGGQDELLPPGRIERWGGGTVIAGAGHLAEWDAPDEVAAALRGLLARV